MMTGHACTSLSCVRRSGDLVFGESSPHLQAAEFLHQAIPHPLLRPLWRADAASASPCLTLTGGENRTRFCGQASPPPCSLDHSTPPKIVNNHLATGEHTSQKKTQNYNMNLPAAVTTLISVCWQTSVAGITPC